MAAVLPPTDKGAYTDTATEHQQGEGYSGHNKIPTVAGLLEKQKQRNKAEDAASAEANNSKDENAAPAPPGMPDTSEAKGEKEEMMEKANKGKENPAKAFKAKGEREVLDPVTGQKVTIKDAEFQDYSNAKLFSREALDPNNKSAGPATNLPGDASAPVSQTAPNPVEPSNICLQQFPPPLKKDTLKPITSSLDTYAYGIMGALGVLWFFTAFKAGFFRFVLRSSLIGGTAVAVYVAHGVVQRKIEKELERIRLDMHKQRGEDFSPPVPESTEWLNAFTAVIWPLINPEMFISLTDMIEDVMQASLPGFIDAVKIDEFGIGKNALRIISMRGLPDQPHHDEYPRDEWINQGDDKTVAEAREKAAKAKKPGENEVDLDESGSYVNMEISFAYSAPPGTIKLRNNNISLIIQFFLGFYDWVRIPIPIYIAVESLVGTVRLRFQMVPQAPFIRNLTFTLMGVPRVEVSAIPMSDKLPNVLDLPLISGFVQSSIAAAANEYVAPRSMTLNMAQMMSGDGIKKDTKALGILAITIHHANDLSAQDDNGYSDPYVVLAFAKFGKPLYSTRIITEELNPVWEETAYLLVSDDEVKAMESLSIQLWDSDKLTADDLVGRINVPLIDLMLKPNEVSHREDTLKGFEDADSMSGTLTWSVAFYDKAKLNPELKKAPGVDHNLPKELQDREELKVETKAIDTAEETDVFRTPPDPKWPAGVFSIIIHQINNLERQNLKGATGSGREGKAGQDTDAPSEQDDNLPSAYCEVVVNDAMIYKTRVKQYSTMPFFEAGTEQFIHDWRDTTVRVVVRDSRLRENDPILGIVNLPLREIFANASQVNRMFSLQDGVGFGRVNISVLFKGVQVTLPKELSGWDTGTVCIKSNIKVEAEPGSDFEFKEKKLLISTSDAQAKLSGNVADASDNKDVVEWDVDQHIRLPVYDRYSSAVFFDYGGGFTLGPLGKKVEAFAAFWLRDIEDNTDKEIRVPIVTTSRFNSLRQNYINDATKKTHEFKIVGWLTCIVHLDSGLDEDHEKYATSQTARHEYETWDRVEGQASAAEANSHAADDGVIDKKEQKQIDASHKKALESRHRGKMQYRPLRTAKWANQGLKDRQRNLKNKILGVDEKQRTVASEA